MTRGAWWRVAVVVAAGSAGCSSSARFVERKPAGGVVAVPDYARRADALTLLKKEVGKGYAIVDEGEVPTGTVTTATERHGSGSFVARAFSWFTGDKDTTTNTTATLTKTEWRITYQTAPPLPDPVPTP